MPRRVRRSRRVTRRRGRGAPARPAARPSLFQRLKGFVGEHKLLSRSAAALSSALSGHKSWGHLSTPVSVLGRIAAAKGYGRRRRVGRRRTVRRRRGRGIISQVMPRIGRAWSGMIQPIRAATGLGRRRRVRRVRRSRR